MLAMRHSEDRGRSHHGWLDSQHTFSFASYYDRAHMGVSHLRVINEDRVVPAAGFPTHSHNDMEIISYVLEGALEHRDSMGNRSVIRPGEVQRMSAGTGVTHSEFNASKTEPVHFLQIWILPNRIGIKPSYEQKMFTDEEKRGKLRLVASPDGRQGSVTIHQDASLYVTLLDGDETLVHPIADRTAYVHVARGEVTVNGKRLTAGDGLALKEEDRVELSHGKNAEVLLFDLV